MSQELGSVDNVFEEEFSDEEHIVIGDDRKISVPRALRRIAVQFDHNVETVTFDCPRYWDGHDMSKMTVYINYMLSNGYKDRYPADNVRVDGDLIHFEWTISRNVTFVDGKISFLVCIVRTDDDGNEVTHWNSEISQAMYVSPGLECTESEIGYDPDLVTQLLERVARIENQTGGKAARIAYVELFPDKWVDDGNSYSQVVSLDDVTENSQVDLTPSVEQLAIFYNKDLTFVTENENGIITVYAIGQKPTSYYKVQVTITEVFR